jgi:DNA primase large subunit
MSYYFYPSFPTYVEANILSSVFEYAHKQEIKKVKDDGTWGAAQLETIVHPNEYFKRSYLLKNLGKREVDGGEDVKMEN